METMAMATPTGFARGGSARGARAEAPLRITRRGRLVLVLLVAVVLVLAARVGLAVAGGPGEPVEVRVHVVSSGRRCGSSRRASRTPVKTCARWSAGSWS